MDITLDPDRLRRRLFYVIAFIALLGLCAEAAYLEWDGDAAEPFMDTFSLSEERNVPTWFSAMTHVVSGCLLALIAMSVRRKGGPFTAHWAGLSAAFFFISLDESITIHEEMHGVVDGGGGAFYFNWIIPASGILLLGGLAYLRFLKHLPARSRRDFMIAGSIFVGGALLMEIPLGLWTDANGSSNMGYVLIDAVEETMEMVGSALFIVALIRHLGGPSGTVNVRLGDDSSRVEPPANDDSLVERAGHRLGAAALASLTSDEDRREG